MGHLILGVDASASGIKVVQLDASLRGVEYVKSGLYPWPVVEVPVVPPPPPAELTPSPAAATPTDAAAPVELPPDAPPPANAEQLLSENLEAVLREMQV